MFYTIYKTTNILNGKFYIGKHKTQNPYDEYLGSGKLLNRAIKKYGRDNFVKEVLYIYDNEALMNLAEKILVVIDPEVSYNLCKGGHGGFGYINENGLQITENSRRAASIHMKKVSNSFSKERRSEMAKQAAKTRYERGFKIPPERTKFMNTKEVIEKRKQNNKLRGFGKGAKNSQYGKPRSEETKRKISESMKKLYMKG